jgi:hypothetical protein
MYFLEDYGLIGHSVVFFEREVEPVHLPASGYRTARSGYRKSRQHLQALLSCDSGLSIVAASSRIIAFDPKRL